VLAEPFVPEPSASEAEVATGKLKMCKSLGLYQIPAELIQDRRENYILVCVCAHACICVRKKELFS
jgi:hypothetical protein